MRPGARVICINDRNVPRTSRVTGAPLVEGMEYTVRAVCGRLIGSWTQPDAAVANAVRLVQNSIYHIEFDAEMFWSADRFREIEPPEAVEEITHLSEPALTR